MTGASSLLYSLTLLRKYASTLGRKPHKRDNLEFIHYTLISVIQQGFLAHIL